MKLRNPLSSLPPVFDCFKLDGIEGMGEARGGDDDRTGGQSGRTVKGFEGEECKFLRAAVITLYAVNKDPL